MAYNPQELTEPVDPNQLRDDVKRLLFRDCKDTTTWDHLGNLDPVRKREEKHVSIVEEENQYHDDRVQYVFLPPAMTLLYEVTQERAQDDGKDKDLLTLFDILATPQEVFDCHDRLYQHAVDRRIRLQAEDDERKRIAQEAEDRECTFKPKVSEKASNLASKAKTEGGYYSECLEWRKQAKKKLQKKVDKEEREKWSEMMEPWKMNDKSVKLVTRMKAREKKERIRARTQSPSQVRRVITPRSHRRAAVDEAQPTFTPLTNDNARKELLLQLGMGFESGDLADQGVESGSDAGGFRMQQSFCDMDNQMRADRATTIVSNLQDRMKQDIEERRIRMEERAKERKAQEHRQQYDRITGQPLFQPNAMPILTTKDGKRLLFSDLSKKDQEKCLKRWSHHEVSFVPALAKKNMTREKRDMQDVVDAMYEKHKQENRKLNKKRDKAAKEEVQGCTFKPEIDRKSHSMASNSNRGGEGYLVTTKAQEHREGRFSDDARNIMANPEVYSTSTTDRNGEKKKKISQSELANLVARQERLARERKERLARKEAAWKREEEENCTGRPKINKESHRLVEDSERRLGSVPYSQRAQPQTERSRSLGQQQQQQNSVPRSPGSNRAPQSGDAPNSFRRPASQGHQQAAAAPPFSAEQQPNAYNYAAEYISPSWRGPSGGSASNSPAYGASPVAQVPVAAAREGSPGAPSYGDIEDLEGLLADWSTFSRSLSQQTTQA